MPADDLGYGSMMQSPYTRSELGNAASPTKDTDKSRGQAHAIASRLLRAMSSALRSTLYRTLDWPALPPSPDSVDMRAMIYGGHAVLCISTAPSFVVSALHAGSDNRAAVPRSCDRDR